MKAEEQTYCNDLNKSELNLLAHFVQLENIILNFIYCTNIEIIVYCCI